MSTFLAELLVVGHNTEEPDKFLVGPQPEFEAWLSLENEASSKQREGYASNFGCGPAKTLLGSSRLCPPTNNLATKVLIGHLARNTD